MLKNILNIALLLVSLTGFTQSVHWADTVLDFTSELSPNQYGAKQVIGNPNVPLNGEDSPNAWTPRRSDRIDFIKVGFENPIKIQQIAVHESYNPGAVYQVFTYDAQDNEYLMFTLTPQPVPINSRMLNIFFQMTEHEVHAIKVVIDGTKVPGENHIDAIGMSDSNIPISVTVKVNENVNTQLETERLSDNVNSPYIEHSPLLSPDGNTLFFSRAHHPDNTGGIDDYEDIWYSERDEETGEWKPAKNMGAKLNTQGPNFISSITSDGKNIILLLGNRYTKSGKMRAGVSISRKEGDTWTEPEPVEIKDDYNYSPKADYFMAKNKEVLLMAIERDDTYGYRDIYVSFKEDDNVWSEPMNIGNTVNTAAEESAPFLDDDMETLYFSSDGYSGYGGSDIYVTKRLDDTWKNWSEPENMGSGINSETDDIYFNLPEVGDYGYFTKGIKEEDTDIYRFAIDDLYKRPEPEAPVLATVKGKVLDTKSGNPVEADVVAERLPDGKEVERTTSDPNTGDYQLKLPYGARYGFRAEADGFISESENIDLNETSGDTTVITTNLMLTPAEPEVKVVMNNIFFDFDKSDIKTSSIPELKRVIQYFKDDVVEVIEVAGHTDSIGSQEYNVGLSERRAKSVQNYLVTKGGIDKSKIKVKWFGETQPWVPNSSISNRRKNRRVEFKVIE